MTPDHPIYILDIITTTGGGGEAFYKALMEVYVPDACQRGMRLDHIRVSPPLWLKGEQRNTIFAMWSMADLTAFWQVMASPAALDGSSANWWNSMASQIESRSRHCLSDASALTDVANV